MKTGKEVATTTLADLEGEVLAAHARGESWLTIWQRIAPQVEELAGPPWSFRRNRGPGTAGKIDSLYFLGAEQLETPTDA